MNQIVILGSSAAGVKVIEGIYTADSSRAITLIAFDGHYPYKRDAFDSFIAKEITREDVFCRAKNFYQRHSVNVILDKQISRINVKRKKIFTEDKTQIDYDVLIVTDTPENRFPAIRGTGKTGVFGYKKLKDIDRILDVLPMIETVAIQSDSFSGLQAAIAFAKRGKEVIFVSSGEDFLSKHFETEALHWLMNRFNEKGLRMIRPNTIAEILGDKDAKAIRSKSGKVFSAQMILFVETDEDLRLFADSGLQMHKKIDVDRHLRTSIDSIFAVDQVGVMRNPGQPSRSGEPVAPEPVTPLSVLEEQGKVVAAAVNGQEYSFDIPVVVQSFDMEGLAITVLGQTETRDGITVRRMFDQESGTYHGRYIKDNCLVGAVLVNAESEREESLRLIRERAQMEPAGDGCLAGKTDSAECAKEDVSTELVDN